MINFGMAINPIKDIISEIKKAGEMGFNYIEIALEPPNFIADNIMAKRSEILKALENYNMFAVGHFAWWANFGEAYDSVREAWIYEMKKAIEAGSFIGMNKIVFHMQAFGCACKTSEGKKETLNRFAASLNELVKEAKKYDVKLLVENNPATNTYKEFIPFLLKKVKDLKFTFDTGHAMVNGAGMNGVKEWFFKFKNRLEHVHVHDNKCGADDEHLPLGIGALDYAWLAKELKKMRYDKTVTFEIFVKDDDLIKLSLEKFKKCLM